METGVVLSSQEEEVGDGVSGLLFASLGRIERAILDLQHGQRNIASNLSSLATGVNAVTASLPIDKGGQDDGDSASITSPDLIAHIQSMGNGHMMGQANSATPSVSAVKDEGGSPRSVLQEIHPGPSLTLMEDASSVKQFQVMMQPKYHPIDSRCGGDGRDESLDRQSTIQPLNSNTSTIRSISGGVLALSEANIREDSEESQNTHLILRAGRINPPSRSHSQGPVEAHHHAPHRHRHAAHAHHGEGIVGREHSGFVTATLPLFWPQSIKRHTSLQASLNMERLEAALEVSVQAKFPGYAGASNPDLSFGRAWPWFILQPTSQTRITLDSIAAAVLVYELAMTPYQLAWEINPDGWIYIVWMTTACFWLIDMAANFVTAYYDEGQVVSTPKEVAYNYLRGWFIMDFFIILCDLVSLFVTVACTECDDLGGGNLRLVRLTRIMRSVTLLRSSRLLPQLEGFLEAHKNGEQFAFGLWLLRMALLVCWGTHLITCVWWMIGRRAYTDTGNRWVEDVIDNERYLDVGRPFQYAIAFHWSLSQLCLGAASVHARSVVEQVFTIFCLILGLLLGTTLISLLSAEMVNSQMSRRNKIDKLKLMRRFLRQYGVNQRQAASVQGMIEERLEHKQPMAEDDFPDLQLLPTSVRMELRYCICKPCMNMHPLLRTWIGLSEVAVQRLCMDAAQLTHRRPNDEVFVAGDHAKEAYILKDGKAIYQQIPASAPVIAEKSSLVISGTVIAEAAMWTEWIYVGTLTLSEYAEVFVIFVKEFVKAIGHHAMLQEISIEYSRLFHSRLVYAKPPRCDYPSDIKIPLTDFEELVFHMQPQVSSAICLHAVLTWKQKWSAHLLHSPQKLEEEVRSGRAVVLLSDKGVVRRVVSVVALRLENPRGQVFVHIADAASGHMVPAVHLPGGKQERGEREMETLQRIMRSKLRPLDGKVAINGMQRADTEEESRKHHMNTKYLRTMCHARLRQGMMIDTRYVECGTVEYPSKQTTAGTSLTYTKTVSSAPTRTSRHNSHQDREMAKVLSRFSHTLHNLGHAQTRRLFSSPGSDQALGEDVEDGAFQIERDAAQSVSNFVLAGKQLHIYKIDGSVDSTDERKYGVYAWLTQTEFDELNRAHRDSDPRLLWYLDSISMSEVESCGDQNARVEELIESLEENGDSQQLLVAQQSTESKAPTPTTQTADYVCVDI